MLGNSLNIISKMTSLINFSKAKYSKSIIEKICSIFHQHHQIGRADKSAGVPFMGFWLRFFSPLIFKGLYDILERLTIKRVTEFVLGREV